MTPTSFNDLRDALFFFGVPAVIGLICGLRHREQNSIRVFLWPFLIGFGAMLVLELGIWAAAGDMFNTRNAWAWLAIYFYNMLVWGMIAGGVSVVTRLMKCGVIFLWRRGSGK